MDEALSTISGLIWNPMAYFVLGLGGVFTILTMGVQFRRLPDMVRQLRHGEGGNGGLSSFQALALTLSSRVGVGSIAGVATAVGAGGPGAIMWMAITGLVGSTVAYAEAVLAQVFKQRFNGEDRGGMPYYIKYGLKAPRFAVVVASIGMIGYGFVFPGIQANNIASSAKQAFGIDTWITGAVVTAVLAIVIVGGTKRIVQVAQAVVPFMAGGYLLAAFLIIGLNYEKVPEAIALIVSSAFGINQVFGGIVGFAVSWGVRRAVFASATGDGEGTFAAAAARTSHPGKQGIVQAFSIYIDVLLICMATGLMIVIPGTYNVENSSGGYIVNNLPGISAGPAFVQESIDSVLSGWGSGFVALAVLLFAFTSQVFYFYVATTNMAFLFGDRNTRAIEVVLKCGAVVISFFGSVVNAKTMWAAGDIGFGILGWLNMACLLLMSPIVYKICRDYERQRRLGLDPTFDPKALNIHGAVYWEASDKPAELVKD
ncbi:alanine/glycine:cation symporter family protein [Rhodococcus koreensis]|uniref:Alanine or glycine:cation symporter, AGCS family n=1 Tax=Rhodococcus koreensis TaxID=99653 RepID=A0A1H4L5T5_9NOCA|nr:alanine/glycine:cation symporter family protein [Rhodococcus koreensis]SEB65798.1 alanine or glycine:cation symporter, AGCS family [Rhodococcus koreensis]